MSGHDVGLLTAGVGGGICFAQAWHYRQKRRIEKVWAKAVRRAAKQPAAPPSSPPRLYPMSIYEIGLPIPPITSDPRAGEAPAAPETVAVEPASDSGEELTPARARSPFEGGEETRVPARLRTRTKPCSFAGCDKHHGEDS